MAIYVEYAIGFGSRNSISLSLIANAEKQFPNGG